MVIYVNGTNKKPETATALKIKSYLQYGTQVYPLINVRGFAEAYEFEEDRESLAAQGGAASALSQTVEVLTPVLGEDVILQGDCVQGLLAFSALAYDASTGISTIHPARQHNLGAQQQSFLTVFSSQQAMLEFSQLHAVEQVIKRKQLTFKEDIVESNKKKVLSLLGNYLKLLDSQLLAHRDFLEKIAPKFRDCQDSFRNAIISFEQGVLNSRRNRWNTFFNKLMDESEIIVEDNFGDGACITNSINRVFKKGQTDTERAIEVETVQSVKELQERLFQALTRLMEDINNVEFQQQLRVDSYANLTFGSDVALDYGLKLADFGSMAFTISSYAVSGGTVGSIFPGIGTAIGAALGAVVGALVTLMGLFTSKASRIRKAQNKVRSKLQDVHSEALDTVMQDARSLVATIQKEIEESILPKVKEMQQSLQRPLSILEEQIARITTAKNQIESMPYGTIQPVQC
ncbi:DUF1269 domain-containing protein [Serratia sp. arafor3]|uniref:DUF1269 domain-containing protein n=1 Tax=Serratia silvae TaxID=2824122 RepID=A0ABT0K906_9GAMM|nr:DUF1269 domain-containing protein [Serratia silvae]